MHTPTTVLLMEDGKYPTHSTNIRLPLLVALIVITPVLHSTHVIIAGLIYSLVCLLGPSPLVAILYNIGYSFTDQPMKAMIMAVIVEETRFTWLLVSQFRPDMTLV